MCVIVEFRQLYAEKLQRNEPWWETDYEQPRRRFRSAWATMPPYTSLKDIRTLVRSLDGLCDSPPADDNSESATIQGDEEQEVQGPAAAELAASLAAAKDDPVAHRLLRRQSEDPCVVAHAIAEELAVELARERSESFALSVGAIGFNAAHTVYGEGGVEADSFLLAVDRGGAWKSYRACL